MCAWPVALCGYQVGRDHAGRGWVSTNRKDLSNPSDWWISNPLVNSDLFLSFANLGSASEADNAKLKEWADRFGLLFKVGDEPDTYIIEDGYGKKDSVIANARTEMRLEYFLAHAEQASNLLNLYKDIRNGNANKIWRRASRPASSLDERLTMLAGPKKLVQMPQDEREGEYYLWCAALLLSEQLTECLSNMRLIADIGDMGATANYLAPLMHRRLRGEDKPESWPVPPHEAPHHLVGSWGCPDLLSAIFFQFYLFVTRHKPERRCKSPACGQLFIPTNEKHVYCKIGCRSTGRNYPS